MPEEHSKSYELILILSPELEEKGLDSIEQEIEKEIKNLGGELKNKKRPEKRSLSYPINKYQSGYYLIVNLLLNPEKVQELLSGFKHKKEILRSIITFIPKEPSPIKPKKLEKKELSPKAKKIVKEVTEEEIEALKKKDGKIEKKKEPEKKAKLEDIDKKLDEILGI